MKWRNVNREGIHMKKVNVINNADSKVNVTINEKDNNGVEIIIDLPSEKVKLSDLKPGQVFRGNIGTGYIFLGFSDDGMPDILRKDLLSTDMKFGSNNNFDGSDIDEYLNTTYLLEVGRDFGSENILKREFDLTSFDGYNDYGKVKRKIGLLDFNRYRRYHKIMGEDMPRWWWLIDPNSTPSGIGSAYVRCVYSNGDVDCTDYSYDGGVRPFLSLNPEIFVSLVE